MRRTGPATALLAVGLLPFLFLVGGCSASSGGSPERPNRAMVEQTVTLSGGDIVAKLRDGADRVEARRLAEGLTVAGASAVQVDYQAGTVRVLVEAGRRDAVGRALRESRLVGSVEG